MGTGPDTSPITATDVTMAGTPLIATRINRTIDAGLVPLLTVGDFVWRDTNRNGIQDVGEPGVPGVTVTLLDNSGVLLATTTTDASGMYSFGDLLPGDYQINFSNLPADTTFTAANRGAAGLDSDANPAGGSTGIFTLSHDDLTRDAGLVAIRYAIGDHVWIDGNGNGLQDLGEAPLPNVSVTLEDSVGVTLATTTTDANGKYVFDNMGCSPTTTVTEWTTAATPRCRACRSRSKTARPQSCDDGHRRDRALRLRRPLTRCVPSRLRAGAAWVPVRPGRRHGGTHPRSQ